MAIEERIRRADIRKMLELSYLGAWGKMGTDSDREFWRTLFTSMGFAIQNLGEMAYKGDGEFRWTDK